MAIRKQFAARGERFRVKGQCFGASVLPADHQGEIMDCYGCVHVFISLNGASYFYDFTVKLLCFS
jgi:hypothetical protein